MKIKIKSVSSRQGRNRLKINRIKTLGIADETLQVTVKSGEISEVKANGVSLIKRSGFVRGPGSVFDKNGRFFRVGIKNHKLVAQEITGKNRRTSKVITSVVDAEDLYPKPPKRPVKA